VAGAEAERFIGNSARKSRRAKVRSCAAERERRRAWMRPFRRTWRAINCSLRLINASTRVIEKSERVAAERPLRASRHMRHAGVWLDKAAGILAHVGPGLQNTLDHAGQLPELPVDLASVMLETVILVYVAHDKLARLTPRFDDTLHWLFDSVISGAIPIPVEEQAAAVARFLRASAPRIPPDLLSPQSGIPCIPDRRPSVRVTVVEAARRIFRGRAPPFLSTCSL
jgi:hypothetical protein